MKVIHLVENLDDSYGGPAKSIPYLCHYLRDLGVEVIIISVQTHPVEHNTVVDELGLQWEKLPHEGPRKLSYSSKLIKRIESLIEADTIIHVHNSWTYVSYVGWYFKQKHQIPLVSSPRGSLYPWSLSRRKYLKRLFWLLFQKASFQRSNVIHVTAQDEAEAVRGLGIKPELTLIPNGVELPDQVPDKQEWRQHSMNVLGLDDSKRYFLFLSRIHPKKGLDFLINSWAEMHDQFPEWELLVVGPEEDQDYLRQIQQVLAAANATGKVRFTGLLEGAEKDAAYGAAEFFVLPSHTENFGIVIAEALALQLPVLTTHGTPWAEIETFGAGWHIELSQERLTTTLREALQSSQEELMAMGTQSKKFIHRYEWPLQARKMKDTYDYILGAAKPESVLNI